MNQLKNRSGLSLSDLESPPVLSSFVESDPRGSINRERPSSAALKTASQDLDERRRRQRRHRRSLVLCSKIWNANNSRPSDLNF